MSQRPLAGITKDMPADLRKILETDPRLDGLESRKVVGERPMEVLKPQNPPLPGDSAFVRLYLLSDDPFGDVKWLNPPAYVYGEVGNGRGLKAIANTPQFREAGTRPRRRADAYEYTSWLVVSGAFAKVVKQFAPQYTELLRIDWTRSNGSSVEGMYFLDVTKLVEAYDFNRSELRIVADRKLLFEGMNYPRAIKPGADVGVHICRDSFLRHEILVSRELAEALTAARVRGVLFQELATGQVLELDYAD